MKKLTAIIALLLFCPLVNAVEWPRNVEMDKVAFQVSAKQWISTESVLLTVTINATLPNADLVKARAEIMSNLNKIASGEWHLIQFDRSQDNSGLEKLYVNAQARILQARLTDIYKNAKDVTKPGATYEINSVEFKPSLDEVQQVRLQLREHLYEQISAELARLNKVYTNQNYTVNRIYFYDGAQPQSQPQVRTSESPEAKMMSVNAMVASPSGLGISVSNELIMSAMVELASNRK